jgi:hypothetical protein
VHKRARLFEQTFDDRENEDPNRAHNTAAHQDDYSELSDTQSISSARERRQNVRKPAKFDDSANYDDSAKFTSAARAQLYRDKKAAERVRMLGQAVPDELAYIDAPNDERQRHAQRKVDLRRRRHQPKATPFDGVRTAARGNDVHAATNANGTPATKRVLCPRRLVPLLAAGVHIRRVQKVRAKYATAVTVNAADTQMKSGQSCFD